MDISLCTANNHILLCCTVPSSVVLTSLTVVDDVLMVSWEEPMEPNDFTWNYTVTINKSTNMELNRTELNMNITNLNISTDTYGTYIILFITLLYYINVLS